MVKDQANEALVKELPIVPARLRERTDHSNNDDVEDGLKVYRKQLEVRVVLEEYKHSTENQSSKY